VNHLCVLSDVQPSYAPPGSVLISVSVLGIPEESDEVLDAKVRDQLSGWYAGESHTWRLLRIARIPNALPRMRGGGAGMAKADGVQVCGDHVATPSIQGSMESGRLAAEAVERRLRGAG
jgi:predicted NAD/FAD-dependent oxidoreductase